MSDVTSSSASTESGGSAKKTAALLRELNDELEEEKKKRFKLERCGWNLVAVRKPTLAYFLPLADSRSDTKTK
jgi:hypothetical protein